ncbi:hypothetical protein ACIGDI_42255 [Streptomyces sp. NPDC085900]|uniref:hypothetical protein n=1 Tax=Streptomyces sp. NPDC085900 TaxID=3365737 RepID=UPI0037D17F64
MGCTWRQLPPVFGPAWPTVYRRFAQWSRDRGLGQAALGHPRRTRRPGRAGLVAARDRLRQRPGGKRGPLTGPNPTDRGKSDRKST